MSDHDEPSGALPAIRIYDVTAGETRMWLDAYVAPDGDLILSGFDCGDVPKRFWGDADYEYWLRVPAARKDALLLQLLLEKLAGDTQATGRFREWLTAKNIPFTFESWV